ncbi:MAG: GGDEF domain-containing protein [Candidatus Gastranaerophilales bacterium]|nr:GGDEF domain-containing protein [Candidatus Gastranaerophilales bacterium]
MSKNYNDLILQNTKIITEAFSPQDFVDRFTMLFKDFFGIAGMDFYTLDYNTGMFRDFVRDWIYIEDPQAQEYIFKIFKMFQQDSEKFIFNGKDISYSSTKEEIEEIKNNTADINLLYFPLFSPERTFGFVEVRYQKLNDDIEIDENLFKVLQIADLQISTAIYNQIVKEHMATGLNFYDAMKNIAKIIESQYELDYIIPQIGEMIDRFISSHLIYIFLKDGNKKYKLLWPSNCNNEEIMQMLENQEKEGAIKISPDCRIGLFPIKGETETLGVLVAYSTIGKLSANEIEYLVELTKQSGITIQRANVYSDVLKHATMDALTGLNNRRQFEIRLKQETSVSHRKKTELCGIMLDIDYFKKVNDTYGHAAGDCVLKGIAEIITKTVREYDIPCRYGGEEFFILLPMTNIDDAYMVAQRLRQNIQNSKIDIRDAKVKGVPFLQITASIGVNKFNHDETPQEFYQGADKALYESKVNGRNRVTVYNSNANAGKEG